MALRVLAPTPKPDLTRLIKGADGNFQTVNPSAATTFARHFEPSKRCAQLIKIIFFSVAKKKIVEMKD